MMCVFFTPPSIADRQALTLGSIPDVMTPLLISRSASFRFKVKRSFLFLSRIPSTSVRKISFSAFRVAAMAPAAVSALMLYVLPFASTPIGAITGMNLFSSRERMIWGDMDSTSPTSPRSIPCPFRGTQLPCLNKPPVFAGQADSPSPVLIDPVDDLLIDLPSEHHLDDIHGLSVGDPDPLDEDRLLPHLGHDL